MEYFLRVVVDQKRSGQGHSASTDSVPNMVARVWQPSGAREPIVEALLERCREFAADGNHHPLDEPKFAIDALDVEQTFLGIELGLIELCPRGRFNTLDRPAPGGRWGLLSFYGAQTTLNGEYLPQLACYVDLIDRLGYPPDRVLFEPGDALERVDHAVLDDTGELLILGEAKVDPSQPADIVQRIRTRYSAGPPDPASRPPKGREYEAWKTADAIWKLRPAVSGSWRPVYASPLTCPSLRSCSTRAQICRRPHHLGLVRETCPEQGSDIGRKFR